MKNLNSNLPEPDQELASDLDWLLQSRQFSAGQVAAGLVQACFLDLYRWMGLCLDDQDAAAASAFKIILAAAEKAAGYSGEPGAQVWVFRMGAAEIRRVVRRRFWQGIRRRLSPLSSGTPGEQPENAPQASVWRAVERLPDEQRLLAILVHGLGWGRERAAQVLDLSRQQAAGMLQMAAQSLYTSIAASQETSGPLSLDELDQYLAAILRQRLTDWSGEPSDLDELARLAGEELDRQDRRQQHASNWKEMIWLAGAAGTIVLVLWVANLWLPEPEGQTAAPTGVQAVSDAGGEPVAANTPAPTPSGPVADYQVQPGDSLASVAAFFGAPVDELRRLNPEVIGVELVPGQTLKVVLRPPGQAAFPTPVMPGGQPVTPLDYWMTPGELVDWLIITPARWVTVWLDGTISDYGPAGVIRAPDQIRFQAWFSKPDQALVITQNADGRLNRALTLGGWQYTSDPQGQIEIQPADGQSKGGFDVHDLVAPVGFDFIQVPGSWQLLRVENFAGRRAVVVDWRPDRGEAQAPAAQSQISGTPAVNHRRIWFDASLGVILRLQELVGDPGEETLVRELVVDSVQYDRVFPHPDRFSPWALNEQVFLERDSGWSTNLEDSPAALAQIPPGRERLPRLAPGPGFDPARARLTLQYPESSPPGKQQVMAEVFADSAYLGQIVLSDPERMLCVRSQDGRQVAYTFDPFGNPDIMGIGWFRLEYPLRLQRIEIPLIPNSLAFSPNGRYLAYFASPLHASPGRLALIDIQTGRQYQLAELIYASSLVWGPDGKSLAMIVADPEPEKREVRILDVATNAVVYRHKVPIESVLVSGLRGPDWPAPDWPARDWNVAFPAPDPTLQECLQPPPDAGS